MNEGVATFFAPFLLMVGGALVAIGLLSLVNLHFFKTPTQGKLALAVGLMFMVGTEGLFATSSAGGRYFEGQKIDLTECQFITERDYPLERRSNPRLVRDKIRLCMENYGYEWSEAHDHCKEGPLATNVFCYLPKSQMERRIVAFQMNFE